MDLGTVFISTFLLVFIGELGDKTQIAAGTGTLANRRQTSTIFMSSVLALTAVAGLTVFGAGLIPSAMVPTLKVVGGILLIIYGIYLATRISDPTEVDAAVVEKSSWGLFVSQFLVVFVAELGDKTQITTLAVAIENQAKLLVVFLASASALIAVTSITIWGITKVPSRWIVPLQRFGIALMVGYGIYMIVGSM